MCMDRVMFLEAEAEELRKAGKKLAEENENLREEKEKLMCEIRNLNKLIDGQREKLSQIALDLIREKSKSASLAGELDSMKALKKSCEELSVQDMVSVLRKSGVQSVLMAFKE